MENLVMEDNTFLDALNVEVEGVKDYESIKEIGASNCQAYVAAAATATMKRDASSKKRAEVMMDCSILSKRLVRSVLHTKKLQNVVVFFKTEARGNDRRMSIFDEIMKIENLSKDGMLVAGDHISKEAHKVDFFFSLPKDFKKDYVLKQLRERNLYRTFSHIDLFMDV
ncbi:hypothetical protein V6N12_025713 [Hibiscus sabdariffa]|uniref:Uncharacterized protein n=1 Tax=Hibiscus sabdariffa TaxID=183260 RepID=A0ABR2AU68_9ROSI